MCKNPGKAQVNRPTLLRSLFTLGLLCKQFDFDSDVKPKNEVSSMYPNYVNDPTVTMPLSNFLIPHLFDLCYYSNGRCYKSLSFNAVIFSFRQNLYRFFIYKERQTEVNSLQGLPTQPILNPEPIHKRIKKWRGILGILHQDVMQTKKMRSSVLKT